MVYMVLNRIIGGQLYDKSTVFDLDGTLLNSQKKISPERKSTLLKCADYGKCGRTNIKICKICNKKQ